MTAPTRVHRLTRADARRVAVRAQLLTRDRPTDLVETVRRLTFLQLDPTNAVAPSADLVAWTRLGAAYTPDDLRAAVGERRLVGLGALLRPAEDIALYRAEMAAWPGAGQLKDWQVHRQDWVRDNDRTRREILARLAAEGPLPSRALPDTCDRSWESTGWTNDKNVIRLLDFMAMRGEVAVAGRAGKPAAQRRWGYFALPVLSGDRLVGKVDARADRAAGALVVHAVHEDAPFPGRTAAAVDRELAALAGWLGLAFRRVR